MSPLLGDGISIIPSVLVDVDYAGYGVNTG